MDGNLTSEWEQYLILRRTPYTTYLFICLVIGIGGNGVVILTYLVKMRDNLEQRFFIPHLAVMDLLACASAAILCLLSNFYPLRFPSDSLCRFFWYTSWTSSAISTLILLLIAIQRYLSVCKPHGPQMSGKWRYIVYGLTVVTCMLLAIPFVYLTGNIKISQVYKGENVTAYYCSTGATEGGWREFETVYFICLFLIGVSNILVTMGFYVPIGLTIYRTFNKQHHQKLNNHTGEESVDVDSSVDGRQISEVFSGDSSKSRKSSLCNSKSLSIVSKKSLKKRTKAKNRFTLMLMLIALIYVLSNVPTLALIVIWKDDPEFWSVEDDVKLNLIIILRRLFLVNNIVNPFLYGYFDLKFRCKLVELFSCKSCR
ncbi:cholecystokinin receptor type A-like [Saccostrea cucullata]|uniref:cholecystokinin receptor type A-like n=1 Tax=Saccostrea cuccullata TaxID=36930 RepID=UPI002ED0CFFE